MSAILVTGASGNIGRALLDELAARGAAARAAVHARGVSVAHAEPVPFDFNDRAGMLRALDGVDRLFLLTPFQPDAPALARAAIDAAREAGVRHVVRVSAIGADDPPDAARRWHHDAEEYLRASGLAWTVLRPNSFMQNFSGYLAPMIREGVVAVPAGDARVSFVDTRDVAAAAAVALLEPGHERCTYVLTGPESLGYDDVAGVLSQVAGRPVRYLALSDEAAAEGARAAGMPEWLVEVLREMNAAVRSGAQAAVLPDAERVLGRPPRRFADFARDHASAWRAAQP